MAQVPVDGQRLDRNFTRQDRRVQRGADADLDELDRNTLPRPFGFERPLTGLEIEFNLIDADQDPAMRNADVLAAIAQRISRLSSGSSTSRSTFVRLSLAGTAVAELETELRGEPRPMPRNAPGPSERISS